MRFNLVDRILEVEPGKRICMVKNLTMAEEYLADHFPTFPVLPGVLMLEALTQAASWVMHLNADFACSMAVLKEARNVKYGSFVAPGNVLRVEVELIAPTATGATFKAVGAVNSQQAVSARLELAYFNLADRQSELADIDRRLIEYHRSRWALIAPVAAAEPVALG
jgi:3-hydroxyacyl-[acyl-carrier-protein] dehydratase